MIVIKFKNGDFVVLENKRCELKKDKGVLRYDMDDTLLIRKDYYLMSIKEIIVDGVIIYESL